ncbi:EAL domain-containing protein [Sphingobium sufflavum]|uniref:EAL domain-containing protein n=1 Tax=Sphingobium sufflavum TaxID=1129547 RepID=UPI001F1A597E|nr:EAL domain-containing protein [Sphingobium sufflavum]MCE7796112.1 EAL domain-containing protein [Sphingobium sufflavum]
MRVSHDLSARDATPSLLVAMGLVESPSGRPPAWLVRALSTISLMWPLVVIARMSIFLALAGPAIGIWLAQEMIVGTALTALLFAVDGAIIVVPRLGLLQCRPPHIQLRWLMPLIFASAALYGMLGHAVFSATGQGNSAALLFAMVLPATVAVSIFGAQRILGFLYCLATMAPFLLSVPEGLPQVVPVAGLLGLLLAAVMQARADQENLQDKQLNQMRGEQALALLTDFEEAGQGWFWESDRAGRLTYVSETLAAKLGRTVAELIGQPVAVMIDQDADSRSAGRAGIGAGGHAGDGQRTVGFHLSARASFADMPVRAATAEECWWSLSGRPVINEFDQFMGFRGSVADLTAMRRSQAEIARLARFDSLTGLANRAQMATTLEQAIDGQKGRRGDCALFLLDLDRFKAVNDSMGHPAGDALLRQVAQRLQRSVGTLGTVGRLGGDEFQVVLPAMIDRADLAKLAETIIHSVSQPYAVESAQLVIGVSIGIAIAPFDGTDADTLIRNADLALYDAKDAGRGVCRFYSQEMHADAEDRRRLEQDLRHAISTGGLHVEYQPVVSTATEKISGFEALVRWDHAQRGAISPAVFIPIAEEAGLIAQIGEWVLRTACDDAIGWPEGTRVAVNVSPIQFRSPAFPSRVLQALARSGLSPERLELEITESVFLDEGTDSDAMFAQLKGLGVRLALDDFGTGYSALRYLRTAPFDKIKIDQSFVRGAAIKGSRNGAIVKAIVSLAEALSMETTAEGAETLDELDLIRSLGCSHMQGYVYGRPTRNAFVMERFATHGVYATASGPKASREPRRVTLRSVKLGHGGHNYDARIRNISRGGAMVVGLADVPVGTVFDVQFANSVAVRATCRWSSEDKMGIEFEQAPDIDLLLSPADVQRPPLAIAAQGEGWRRAG